MIRRRFLGAGAAAGLLETGCDFSLQHGVFNGCSGLSFLRDLRLHLVEERVPGLEVATPVEFRMSCSVKSQGP
jgi:hypothetical protein